jgi:predicted O-methyltransferase YrrM
MADFSCRPETWRALDELGPPVPYDKSVFGFVGSPTAFHRTLQDAPTGRFGVPILIDLGIDGYLQREDALILYETALSASADILELGTHKGLSTSILAQALRDRGSGSIETVDIDAATSAIARQNLDAAGWGSSPVTFTVADATKRLDEMIAAGRKFGMAFIDHWHGYDATYDAASRLHRLLLPGGFVVFHDFLDPANREPRHVYKVYQAVMDTIGKDDRFRFVCNSGCCGLFQFNV